MQLANIEMNSYPKILGAIAGTFFSLITIDVNSAFAGNFTFTKIVDTRGLEVFAARPPRAVAARAWNLTLPTPTTSLATAMGRPAADTRRCSARSSRPISAG